MNKPMRFQCEVNKVRFYARAKNWFTEFFWLFIDIEITVVPVKTKGSKSKGRTK